MMKRMSVVFALCALFLFIVPVYAQDKPADTNQLVREKVQADKKLFVAENMQLTEKEAKAFWPVYENYQRTWPRLSTAAKTHRGLCEELPDHDRCDGEEADRRHGGDRE
jgi:hypothetical protein